jgi:hypothetical protein
VKPAHSPTSTGLVSRVGFGGALLLWMRHIREPALSVLVVLELLILFVGTPLGVLHDLPRSLELLIFAMIGAVGIVVVSHNSTALAIILLALAGSLTTSALSRFLSSDLTEYFDFFTNLAFLGVLTWVVGVAVFARGKVTFHRIQGAIAIYLQIAVMFAFAYSFLYHLSPQAFSPLVVVNHSGILPETLSIEPKAIYFSFVTLTSTGYGDIVPVHPVARSLSSLEAVIGQLFPATLLARLVTLEIQGRRG